MTHPHPTCAALTYEVGCAVPHEDYSMCGACEAQAEEDELMDMLEAHAEGEPAELEGEG